MKRISGLLIGLVVTLVCVIGASGQVIEKSKDIGHKVYNKGHHITSRSYHKGKRIGKKSYRKGHHIGHKVGHKAKHIVKGEDHPKP